MKIRKLLLLFFTLFSLSVSSQTNGYKGVTSSQLTQHMKGVDSEIERLRSISKAIAQTLDGAEERANYAPNPQRFIDFILLRYERNDSYVQVALAEKAQEGAEYLTIHKYDNHGIEKKVIQQGIDKYNDMCSFFIDRAKQLRSSFTKHWNIYSAKYGTTDQEIFIQDNNELATYGIETK